MLASRLKKVTKITIVGFVSIFNVHMYVAIRAYSMPPPHPYKNPFQNNDNLLSATDPACPPVNPYTDLANMLINDDIADDDLSAKSTLPGDGQCQCIAGPKYPNVNDCL